MMDPEPLHCFHCNLEVKQPVEFQATVLGEARPMCCAGCTAVAQAIVEARLESYYSHRSEPSRQGAVLVPEQLKELTLYDHPDIQKTFVHSVSDHIQEASLILEGITCAACVWLNQQHLSRLDGVLQVEINYTSLKALVKWDARKTNLSDILEAIQLIGYTAHPYDPARRQHVLEKSRKDILKRLGIAGIFGMQVMGLAISLYLDDGTMDLSIRNLLQRSSFILTLPVILYAARPFFDGAINDLKHWRFGMDTPVALGISLAFLASVYTLIAGRGEIYFDSVCMFSFFLLGARYLEVAARKRAADSADVVTRIKPVIARKLTPDGAVLTVPALELVCGDKVVVHAGDIIPADGLIVSGQSNLDESILTGESQPQFKTCNDQVVGGSLNIDSPITVEINRIGNETVLAGIQRLLDAAQQAKPAIAQLADRIAGWFVLGVLSLATITGIYWFQQDPANWLSPTIAVLIVSCPCALSLATPATITTAIGRLMKDGIVVSRKSALESLHRLDVLFFDKTGTLTEGNFRIQSHSVLDPTFEQTHFSVCSAIEVHSEHPVAKAFTSHPTSLIARDARNTAGKGITAKIGSDTWFLGTPEFIREQTGLSLDEITHSIPAGLTPVVLARTQGIVSVYALSDTLKPGSAALVRWLKRKGIEPIMLTGDQPGAAHHIAELAGIDTVFSGQLPADKLKTMQGYQRSTDTQKIVGMVGDGINDSAVLGGADCSIATQGAATLASTGSDILMLTPKMQAIQTAIEVARRTHNIIRQNLIWATSYNLLAIPAAAMGYVPPWLAAIGMSLSSLMVVLNALRLKNSGTRETRSRNTPLRGPDDE